MIDFSKNPLFLAPMAGFSDLPFRSVVKKFGCDVTVSEMISSNALVFENHKTLQMVEKSPLEKPYIVQIAGSQVDVIKKSVEILNDIDFIDGIDLNCGCPVPKVVRQNAGSSLLTNPNLLYKIIETIKKTSNKKYTSIKIRLGFNDKDAYKIVKEFENLGLDFIAVHGRTRAGGYSSKVDYDAIAKIRQNTNLPLIANGDINQNNFQEVLKITGANGLMIGRAAVGNPWIFYQIKNEQSPNLELKKEIILFHFDEMISHYGAQGVAIFRKHLHKYSNGQKDASSFRNEINKISDIAKFRQIVVQFFS